jgi:hypothetical protein
MKIKNNELIEIEPVECKRVVIIPDDVKIIKEGAICNCEMNSLIIGKNVKKIESNSIKNCKNLINLMIKSPDIYIESNAISNFSGFLYFSNPKKIEMCAKSFVNSNVMFDVYNAQKEDIKFNIASSAGLKSSITYYQKNINNLLEEYTIAQVNQILRGYDNGINISFYHQDLDANLFRKIINGCKEDDQTLIEYISLLATLASIDKLSDPLDTMPVICKNALKEFNEDFENENEKRYVNDEIIKLSDNDILF